VFSVYYFTAVFFQNSNPFEMSKKPETITTKSLKDLKEECMRLVFEELYVLLCARPAVN
jgi:hypothetical protein